MKLKISLQNIVPFLKTRIMCFESLAFKNMIELEFTNNEDKIFVYFDPQKIEGFIFNLLVNAFNYTPPGGKITVSLQSVMESAYPSGNVKIVVHDAGSFNNKSNSTGAGQALSREMLEFVLRLPAYSLDIEHHQSITNIDSTQCVSAYNNENLIPVRFPGELEEIGAPAEKEPNPGKITLSPVDIEFMKEIQNIIEKNLTNPSFGVTQMAKLLYISRSSLFKKIKALTGQSAQFYIRSYRLQRAAQLLKAGSGNVTEVAFEVGFSSAAYFTKCFKEKFHQLPSHYLGS
ncbi:MAG: helix-turn-helix domain-containing protein [Acidobacteria bacterium]|jgi:AraC-like DNA-binding protein|nr:helix-turn-helix domain-containing protein [Acidobacteriota bacterium]